MNTLHAYEIVGEILLRKSGNQSPLRQCMVIRTQGRVRPELHHEGNPIIEIADIQSGFTSAVFPYWFSEWDAAVDDIHPNATNMAWEGRRFEVAIEKASFEALCNGSKIHGGSEHIVAAKINGLWTSALHGFNPALVPLRNPAQPG